ncbi:MAG: hypothetical protein ABWY20_19385 [Mycobacterium sp.]
MRACAYCGAEVEGNYRRVVGWERVRRRGGGLNKLLQRTETGEHACDGCGYALTHSVQPGTATLFDVPPVQPLSKHRDHA